jgi:predicted aminopeptidase
MFIHHDTNDLAEILFHELAHQRVFAKGDTDFNEAFATAVGEEGVRRWLEVRGDAKARADYEVELRRKDQFVALVMQARAELEKVYGEEAIHGSRPQGKTGSESLVAAKRAAKEAVIARLRANYARLKEEWGGYAAYDGWFQRPINNARLNTIAAYYTLVPAFKQLLAQQDGNLTKFYAEAKSMAALSKEQRQERIAALSLPATAPGLVLTLPSGSVAQ